MAEVPAGEKEKKALIQLRNDVVRYLAEKSSKVEGTVGLYSFSLFVYITIGTFSSFSYMAYFYYRFSASVLNNITSGVCNFKVTFFIYPTENVAY